MSTALRAMQPVVRGLSIVSKVEDVHLHMRLSLKESCLKLESLMPIWDGRIPSDDLWCASADARGCLAATQVAGEGHECQSSSFLF